MGDLREVSRRDRWIAVAVVLLVIVLAVPGRSVASSLPVSSQVASAVSGASAALGAKAPAAPAVADARGAGDDAAGGCCAGGAGSGYPGRAGGDRDAPRPPAP